MNTKRKLIETQQEYILVCDNEACDFKIKNETGEFDADIEQYLNMPCPKCGKNLLTEEDYINSQKLSKTIKWVNKWFGWMSIFYPKQKVYGESCIHIHKGFKIFSK